MSHTYARFYIILALFLLFLLKRSDAFADLDWNYKILAKQSKYVVMDAARKGEAVWRYREVYQRYVSYAIGERVYVIRSKFADMLRSYLRYQYRQRKYRINDLVRNALILQKKAQVLYDYRDELVEFDKEISHTANYLNKPRFGDNNCHLAGPQMEGRPNCRRSLTSKNYGSMDRTLELIDARRAYIHNKYKTAQKIERPIDINADIKIKFNSSSGFKTQKQKTDFVDIAPYIV